MASSSVTTISFRSRLDTEETREVYKESCWEVECVLSNVRRFEANAFAIFESPETEGREDEGQLSFLTLDQKEYLFFSSKEMSQFTTQEMPLSSFQMMNRIFAFPFHVSF